MNSAPSHNAETPADFGDDPAGVAARWISELDLADKDQRPWRDTCRSIIKLYRAIYPDDGAAVKKRRFSLLWSNIETLSPAVYARTPTAVVGRRFKDSDPVARLASEVLERALNFQLDALDFADVMLGARLEFLLLGRGVCWVRYVPHMRTVTSPPTATMGPVAAAGDGQLGDGGEPYEVVAWEEAVPDHVSWDDFLHNPARKWSEVRWVARRVYMTRAELRARFGRELGDKVPLDHGPAEEAGQDRDAEQWKKAVVYEVWDKVSREALWISRGHGESPLDRRRDPLGLQDFFPCPRPLLGTCSPDSITPTPDYSYYESQAKDINELTARIGRLTDQLRMRGFYAAGNEAGKKLDDLLNAETGTMIPIESWTALQDNGGVERLIAWLPLDLLVSTLKSCIEARQQLVDDVYQITGIADILRGDVDPDETATATRTKATWGASRVRDKQKELARFARDTLRIMGQVIAAKFSAETMSAMTNIQLLPTLAAKQQAMATMQFGAPGALAPPAALAELLQKPSWEEVQGVLRDAAARAFRIDIETDSTIEPDDQDEKQRRIEFVQAVAAYVEKTLPVAQLAPEMLPVLVEGLKFLVRGFRVGREMEETIDRAMDQLQARAGAAAGQPGTQAAPPKGPNPQVEQMKGQAAVTQANARMLDAQTRQFEAQTDRFTATAGAQNDAAQITAENARTAADRAADQAMHGQSLAADLRRALIAAEQRRLVTEAEAGQPFGAPTP